VYGFYRDEADTLREKIGFLDYIYQCKGCLICIQNCTKGVLTRVVNPEYERLGDDYYTPEIIVSTWYQAETGSIPVTGSGYGGPFSGPGFDSMWTDMSEIVRPTRDGIHGREYISTSVDIGRKLPHLSFVQGQSVATPPSLMEIPFPVIFEIVPLHFQRTAVVQSIAKAATMIGTLFIANGHKTPEGVSSEWTRGCNPLSSAIPLYETEDIGQVRTAAPMVMVPYSEHVLAFRTRTKAESPNRLVAIRLEATPNAPQQVCQLTRDGAEVVHLVFDAHGREREIGDSHLFSNGNRNCETGDRGKIGDCPPFPRHMRDALREIHRALVKEGTRDLVTLIASGGIAQAEHVVKAIICGADLVAIDLPLLIALECRLCGECKRGEPCPIHLEEIDEGFAVQRIVNLMGAWRDQILEMLGAMGIREVRRLRGETGRAMFFEDLEAATFGRMFGRRRCGA
jgi:ferredoxin